LSRSWFQVDVRAARVKRALGVRNATRLQEFPPQVMAHTPRQRKGLAKEKCVVARRVLVVVHKVGWVTKPHFRRGS